jgi:hypothetical protein
VGALIGPAIITLNLLLGRRAADTGLLVCGIAHAGCGKFGQDRFQVKSRDVVYDVVV